MLGNLSHYAKEPAARKLETTRPGLAARRLGAHGLCTVNAGKSKYDDAAISNFESAQRCYVRAELAAAWEQTVQQLLAAHRREIGFLSRIEAFAARIGQHKPPSFLERAKARWGGERRGEPA